MGIASHCEVAKPEDLFQAAFEAGWVHGPGPGPRFVDGVP